MHVVPFKLKENAKEFQVGEYIGFGIRTGIKYPDKKNGDQWTNYQAAIFAKSPAQIDFYRSNLIAGALVVVSSDYLAVETFQGQNGVQTSIKMVNANVKSVHNGRAPDAAQQAYNQGMNQQPRQATNPQANYAPQGGFSDFDSDIPFMRLHHDQ